MAMDLPSLMVTAAGTCMSTLRIVPESRANGK
jgi:hypothetical protein